MQDPYQEYCDLCESRGVCPLGRAEFETKYWRTFGPKAREQLDRFLEDYHPPDAFWTSAYQDYASWSKSFEEWPLPEREFELKFDAKRKAEAPRSFAAFLAACIPGQVQHLTSAGAYSHYCQATREAGLWPMTSI